MRQSVHHTIVYIYILECTVFRCRLHIVRPFDTLGRCFTSSPQNDLGFPQGHPKGLDRGPNVVTYTTYLRQVEVPTWQARLMQVRGGSIMTSDMSWCNNLTQPMAELTKLSGITCLVGKISRLNGFISGSRTAEWAIWNQTRGGFVCVFKNILTYALFICSCICTVYTTYDGNV